MRDVFLGSAGYEKFMKICSQTKYEVAECVSLQWWNANIKNQKSRVPLVCCECKANSGGTQVCDFQRKRTAACWCNGGLTYATEQGRLRVLSWCTEEMQPTGFMCDRTLWHDARVKAQTKLPIRCSKCMTIASVSVNNFDKQRTILCVCSNRWEWSTEEKRIELLNKMTTAQLLPIGTFNAVYDKEAWSRLSPTKSTYIQATCLKCHSSIETTTIGSFIGTGTKGCGCKNKTEDIMVKLLHNAAAGTGVDVKRQVDIGKSTEGGSMRIDAGLYDGSRLIAVFECDGNQHFMNSFHFSDTMFQSLLQRDLMKENIVVAKGAAVVRVYQPDLWGGNGNPKRVKAIEFVKLMAHTALDGMLEAGVHCQPDVQVYQSGVYRNMRGGNGKD